MVLLLYFSHYLLSGFSVLQIDIGEVIARCVEMNMLHQRFDRYFQLSPIETPWNIGYDDE